MGVVPVVGGAGTSAEGEGVGGEAAFRACLVLEGRSLEDGGVRPEGAEAVRMKRKVR